MPQLAGRIFGVPLAIEPGKLAVILTAIGPRVLGREVLLDLEVPAVGGLLPGNDLTNERERKPLTRRIDGVAVMDINGTLVHRSSWMDALSGLVSYDQIQEELDAATADPNVRGIVLALNSPGGEVGGMLELAARIREANGSKPVVAVAADLAASAAYVLGAAAGKFLVGEAAVVGSVGVVYAHLDVSEADKMAGVKVTHVHAGARKVDGNPHQPLEGEAMHTLQALVDETYGAMVRQVSKHRGLVEEAVRATEARVYVGPAAATALGLADGLGTVRGAVEILKRGAGVSGASSGGRVAVVTRPKGSTTGGSMELEAQLQAAQAALAEMAKERDSIKAALEAQGVETLDLRARVKGLETAQKDAVVEKHVRAGRVTPAMRADVGLLAEHLTADELDARLGKWSQVTRPVGTGTSQGAEEATEAKPLDLLNAKAR